MALFMKQNFTPSILSRKWMAMKLRPNMLIHSTHHIISILESGLLFREDSIEVEQEAPSPEEVWRMAGGGTHGWFTKGEKIVSLAVVTVCIAAYPPKNFNRSTLMQLALYFSIPVTLRTWHRIVSAVTPLYKLLSLMRDYLALARRTAACVKEYTALHNQLDSLTSAVQSTHTMLCRQQNELAVLMSRASSALLGNTPWLRGDVAWDCVTHDNNLMKIHHAFLVVQSTLLKHIAMAHFVPPIKAQKLYKNHNERIYWIHHVLIKHLCEEFETNFESLDRMYRLLKNYGNKDVDILKRPGSAIYDNWLYSDVHTGIATTSLELKVALNKCTSLDMFLDSCAMNKQDLDIATLKKDIEDLIKYIEKSMMSAVNSQIRLRKLLSKFNDTGEVKEDLNEEIEIVEDKNDAVKILKIDNREPETKDEVFYFVKTDDDDDYVAIEREPVGDIITGPGKKERETTKMVLNELKRKLVGREDIMRERERQALIKTMPEFKNNLPEFPRQILINEVANKGIMQKLNIQQNSSRKKIFKDYKIKSRKSNFNHSKLKLNKNRKSRHISPQACEAITLKVKNNSISVEKDNNHKEFVILSKPMCATTPVTYSINRFGECSMETKQPVCEKIATMDENVNSRKKNNTKSSKSILELSPSSSESDFDFDEDLVRLVKKKQYPINGNSVNNEDEGLKPIEYSIGTGMAIASMLKINNSLKLPNMVQEEVFIGDGEVSSDSGNDEDV